MTDHDLRNVYESFLLPGVVDGMDSSTWAKCCRDCNVIDGKQITETDVDIAFNKVKYVIMR